MRTWRWVVTYGGLLALGLSPVAGADLRVVTSTRTVGGGRRGEVTLLARRDASVRLSVFDLDGNLRYRGPWVDARRDAPTTLGWDGTGCEKTGRPEAYLYRLAVRRTDGTSLIHGDPWLDGEVRVEIPEIRGGQATVVLTGPALVRVRAGGKGGGAVLATLKDWEAVPAGKLRVSWGGCDPGRHLCLRRDRLIVFEILPLPENAFIVEECLAEVAGAPVAGPAWRERVEGLRHGGQEFWRHPARERKDPDVVLRWRAAGEVRDGSRTLDIDLPGEDREPFLNAGFEARIFVDGSYLTEEEVGFLPYGLTLSEDVLGPGRHAITVNLLDSRGYVATGTIAWPGDAEGEPRGDGGQ